MRLHRINLRQHVNGDGQLTGYATVTCACGTLRFTGRSVEVAVAILDHACPLARKKEVPDPPQDPPPPLA